MLSLCLLVVALPSYHVSSINGRNCLPVRDEESQTRAPPWLGSFPQSCLLKNKPMSLIDRQYPLSKRTRSWLLATSSGLQHSRQRLVPRLDEAMQALLRTMPFQIFLEPVKGPVHTEEHVVRHSQPPNELLRWRRKLKLPSDHAGSFEGNDEDIPKTVVH
ncbi:hypothetical protein CTAM01_11507 [Colletotrichum tamarilloi]|uniref:Uncharacterized protein n=1 Tax=Colletotrichum tamarilloi TaxID=1209934 RepID=A0ABQ9QXF8_9PEZI|nr:uncharacterized protein CTAM01_11507 [Colletotrichum tamarilloi]KAK1488135.1 hypothetical protein CTAM01_11507 [Colletotrichum tamarilloi]